MRDQARRHVAFLGLFRRLRDGERELRGDLDRRRITAEFRGPRLQRLDALLELGPGPPARQPAGPDTGRALHRFHVVPAIQSAKGSRLGLGYISMSRTA